ncbi:MAG: ThiF family adenylyltransferase [Sneathiella sp.]
MTLELTLAISLQDHETLERHLFPGDGLEAAAMLICGRAGTLRERLCVRSVIKVPYQECPERTPVRLVWPGSYLERAIDAADEIGGSVILIHSHPGGFFGFSEMDNLSDAQTIPSLRYGSTDETIDHGSAIMIPGGSIKARLFKPCGAAYSIDRIFSIGDDIKGISKPDATVPLPFSSQMTDSLKGYSACVVGASGTGSIVIENLCRRGIGKLVIIDYDIMKSKNLNRILNSTTMDAQFGLHKTKMLKAAIVKYRPDIEIVTIEAAVETEEAIIAASGCDVIFSCVDTMEARHYCDLMVRAFIIPLIDVGVTIPTRQQENKDVKIADVCGRIDYVRPDGPSLTDRGVVTPEGLYAEYLSRVDPSAFESQLEEGYLKGFAEEAPSVLTLNMMGASLAVEEWMARVFPYRHDANSAHDRLFFSLAGCEFEYEKSDSQFHSAHDQLKGRGLCYPLLGFIQPAANEKVAV